VGGWLLLLLLVLVLAASTGRPRSGCLAPCFAPAASDCGL